MHKFFLILVFLILSTAAKADIGLGHFDIDSRQWQKQKIIGFNWPENLSLSVSSKCAWLKNGHKFAFFDGNSWQQPQPILGMDNIQNISPAFPLSGQSCEAWAIGQLNGQSVISFFDGNSWQQMPAFDDKLIPVPNPYYAVSHGKIWVLLRDKTQKKYYLLTSSVHSPKQWQQSALLPLDKLNPSSLYIVANNDVDDGAFIGMAPKLLPKLKLYKINQATAGIQLVKEVKNNITMMYQRNNTIVLAKIISSPPGIDYEYSIDNGLTWRTTPAGGNGALAAMSEKMFCAVALTGSYECLDMTNPNSTWVPVELNMAEHIYLAYVDGYDAIFYSDIDSEADIKRFNIQTNTLSTTEIPLQIRGPKSRLVEFSPINGHMIAGVFTDRINIDGNGRETFFLMNLDTGDINYSPRDILAKFLYRHGTNKFYVLPD